LESYNLAETTTKDPNRKYPIENPKAPENTPESTRATLETNMKALYAAQGELAGKRHNKATEAEIEASRTKLNTAGKAVLDAQSAYEQALRDHNELTGPSSKDILSTLPPAGLTRRRTL
jgi:hypothetical protein